MPSTAANLESLPTPNRFGLPNLGLGLGLRTVHFAHILREKPEVDWFEIISENFMDTGGRPMFVLDRIAERYPIVMHGVSLSIGSTDPLNFEYLTKLKRLSERVRAVWVSDHICWTGVRFRNTHDLLPMPYTEESLRHIVSRIRQVQEFLERPLVLENASTYCEFSASSMSELEFVRAVAEEADCGLLLDVNNVYVSAFNHGFDATEYVRGMPHDRVTQIHLAGHTNFGTHILDTHSDHVIDPVWELYRLACRLNGGRATLLEWDENIPEFEVVHDEVKKARRYIEPVPPHSARSPSTGSQSTGSQSTGSQSTGSRMAEINSSAGSFRTLSGRPSRESSGSTSGDKAPQRTPSTAPAPLSLAELQAWFQDRIMEPHSLPQGRRRRGTPAERVLQPSSTLDVNERIEIYSRMYFARLCDCLQEDYSAVACILGEVRFQRLVRAFLTQHPSQHYSLTRLGDALPEFLEGPVRVRQKALIQDVAKLEYAMTRVFDAEEVPVLTADHVAAMAPETFAGLQLAPVPAFELLEFSFDSVNRLVTAARQEEEIPAVRKRPAWAVVYRKDYRVWRLDIDRWQHALLEALLHGALAIEAIEAAANAWNGPDDGLERAIHDGFQEFIGLGLFRPTDA